MIKSQQVAVAFICMALNVGPALRYAQGAETTQKPQSSAGSPLPDPILTRRGMDEMPDQAVLAQGRSKYLSIIIREAEANGLPPEIADAVVRVESAYDSKAIGSVGEIGLMQIRPSTAGMLGFKGTLVELAEPTTNIRYGVRYLAQAWRLAKGDLCRTLMKYRAGHGSEHMSALSTEYCRRARIHLAALRGDAAAKIGMETVVAPALPTIDHNRLKQSAPRMTRFNGYPAAQSGGLRSSHSLIVANRAQSREAWNRASGRVRSQVFWAEQEARQNALRRQFFSTSVM